MPVKGVIKIIDYKIECLTRVLIFIICFSMIIE